MRFHLRTRAFFAFVAAASLAACGGHATVPPTMPFSPQSIAQGGNDAFVFPAIVPPDCNGQFTATNKASVTQTFQTTGGHVCIPAFGGFGGTIKYPPVTTAVKVKLISSTTALGGTLPKIGPAGHNPIFYLQLNTTGPVTFGSTLSAGGGLTGASIVAGRAYTVYGQATVFGFTQALPLCYVYAVSGTYGGVLTGFGSLLKGQSVPAAVNALVEVYPGKSATNKCT